MSNYEPQSIGWWMEERRGELGLLWADVAKRAGVSEETLYRIAKNNRPMRTMTRKGIERALAWVSGSVDDILAGEAPTNADDETDPEPSYDERLDALEAHARETLEQIEAMRRERSRLQERRRTAR